MTEKTIYLDHAATTPMLPQAVRVWRSTVQRFWGNPSSIHHMGREARECLEEARRKTAALLHCLPEEIFFTSSGTEGDNWCLRGVMDAPARTPGHLIVSAIEHHAVLSVCHTLEARGIPVSLINPTPDGVVDPDAIRACIRPESRMISVMSANNETGAIQPVEAIARLAHENGLLFHTDAVQAAGHIPLFPHQIACDMMTLSAHKFGGPRGVGIQFIKQGTRLDPLLLGGEQEHRMRASTENLPGICAAAEALDYALAHQAEEAAYVLSLRKRLADGLQRCIGGVTENAAGAPRLPGILNIRFDGAHNEAVLIQADLQGICLSAGSACTAGIPEPSHVLLAMGQSVEQAQSSVRFSLSGLNTEEEIDYVLSQMPAMIQQIRTH